MSAIDPMQGSRAAIAQPSDSTQLDAASLLMMLSWKQLDALHGSLLASVNVAQNDFSTLGRIGEMKSDLARLKFSVLQKELDNTEKILPRAEQLQDRVNNAGSDPVVLTEADQNDLRRLEEWAKERGFVASPLMLEQRVKPLKTEADKTGPKDSAEKSDAPPEMQTVLNQAAYLEFRDALRGYLSELKAGTADNPALRSQFQNSPEYEQLTASLKSLGISILPDSPQSIEQALTTLGQLTGQIITRLESQAEKMQRLIGEVESSSRSLGELKVEGRRSENAAAENKLDAQRSEFLAELDADQRARLEQVLDTLQKAQDALAKCDVVPDQVDWPQLDTRLGDELTAQFEKWEAGLQSLLEPPPSPPQAENRSIRSGKQFV